MTGIIQSVRTRSGRHCAMDSSARAPFPAARTSSPYSVSASSSASTMAGSSSTSNTLIILCHPLVRQFVSKALSHPGTTAALIESTAVVTPME